MLVQSKYGIKSLGINLLKRNNARDLSCYLARSQCRSCNGSGINWKKFTRCDCICQSAFKNFIVLYRYYEIPDLQDRFKENFRAELWLSAKRVLSNTEFKVFKLYYLERLEARCLTKRLHIDQIELLRLRRSVILKVGSEIVNQLQHRISLVGSFPRESF